MNKRVKIVAIRGGKKFGEDGYWSEKLDPDASAKNIAQLIEEGANVFRFNFSHGNHAEQGERMDVVRMAESIAGQKVGFLLDTKGPEIRTELFEGDAKEYAYKTGEQIRIATKQGLKSTRDVIALNVAGALDIFDDVEVGKQVLVDDGKLGLRVVDKDAEKREFIVEVENDGIIAKQKGVNIPYTKIPFPALAERDNAVLTLSQSHLYVLRKTYKKYVLSVKKLETATLNCWLKSKTNKVSIISMKSLKLLMVS